MGLPIILALIDSSGEKNEKEKIAESKAKELLYKIIEINKKNSGKNNVNKLLKNSTLSNLTNISKFLNKSFLEKKSSNSSSSSTIKRKK